MSHKYNEANVIKLTQRFDYDDWYDSIKNLAKMHHVWEYCDPVEPKDRQSPEIPSAPTNGQSSESTRYKNELETYKIHLHLWDREERSLLKINERIEDTVDVAFQSHYLGEYSVSGKLKKLQAIAPTRLETRNYIMDIYHDLMKKPNKSTLLEAWLEQWRHLELMLNRTVTDGITMASACDRFIEASRDINPPFFNTMMRKTLVINDNDKSATQSANNAHTILDLLERLQSRNPPSIDNQVNPAEFTDMINNAKQDIERIRKDNLSSLDDSLLTLSSCITIFREHLPHDYRGKDVKVHSLMATFQGVSHTASDEKDKGKGDKGKGKDKRKDNDKDNQDNKRAKRQEAQTLPPCVCGYKHRYKDCEFMNSKKGKKESELKESIKDSIIRKFNGDQSLFTRVKRIYKDDNSTLLFNYILKRVKDTSPPIPVTGSNTINAANRITELSPSPTSPAYLGAVVLNSTHHRRNGNDLFKRLFMVDSGANTHVCNDLTRLINVRSYKGATIQWGNSGGTCDSIGDADLRVSTPDGPKTLRLEGVLYIPGFHFNLLSLKLLQQKNNCYWDALSGYLIDKHRKPLLQILEMGDFYTVEIDPFPGLNRKGFSCEASAPQFLGAVKSRTQPVVLATLDEMHRRMNHAGLQSLLHLEGSSTGLKLTTRSLSLEGKDLCDVCASSDIHQIIDRTPVDLPEYAFQKICFDRIHLTEGANFDQYIFHTYDPFSGFHYAESHADKTEATVLKSLRSTIISIQKQGYTVQTLMSDNASEYGREITAWVKTNGLQLISSAPDTHSQNGLAERSGKAIITSMRKAMLEAKFPSYLWPQFLSTAIFLLNRTPIQRKDWRSPIQILTGQKPDLSRIRIPGSRVYVLLKANTTGALGRPMRLDKMSPRSLKGWLIGSISSNIFIIWFPQLKRIYHARDVLIDEKERYDGDDKAFEINERTREILRIETYVGQGELLEPFWETTSLEIHEPESSSSAIGNPRNPPESDVLNQLLGGAQEYLDNLNYPTPTSINEEGPSSPGKRQREESPPGPTTMSVRKIKHIKLLGDKTMKSCRIALVTAVIKRSAASLSPPPKNYQKFLVHDDRHDFKLAMDKEIASLEAKHTWEEVDTPQDGSSVIPLKWVWTHKLDTDNNLKRFKARICVRGDLQPDVDEDLYASAGAYRTFRILMAMIAAFDLECHQVDVANAFLNAELDSTVYVACPEGYQRPGKCLLLLRALYGLNKSPLLWFNEVTGFLKELRYVPIPDEPCLLIHPDSGVVIFLYVDDFLLISRTSQKSSLLALKAELHKKYGVEDFGEAQSFLNIRILRDRVNKQLWISQDQYVDKLTKKFHLKKSNWKPKTPLACNFEAIKNSDIANAEFIQQYQQKIGSLIHPAIVARPDIAFAASQLSRFNSNPTAEHMAQADRVIQYLLETKFLAIKYSGMHRDKETGEIILPKEFGAASDASFADNYDTRFSSQGYLLYLFDGPISWQASRQKTVTTSTTEAELLALSNVGKEVMAMARLFSQIGLVLDDSCTILCDNQQTVSIVNKKAPQLTTKLRHVDIHQFWLRQEVQSKTLDIAWIPTKEQPADGFTKILGAQPHSLFVKMLNMESIPEQYLNTLDD